MFHHDALSRPLDRTVAIDVQAAFREVNRLFLELLESIQPTEWALGTIHRDRDVKDLVAHLVDGSMRRLSVQRDHYIAAQPLSFEHGDLVAFIQSANREWMRAARRLSPRILIDMAAKYDSELLDMFYSVYPFEDALYQVTWAGEAASFHWFDVAREYTEKWHHQQQLRDALCQPPLYDSWLFGPVLDTFARGLPFAFRSVPRSIGDRISVQVTGDIRRCWTLDAVEDGWFLSTGSERSNGTKLIVPADCLWRLWTKGYSPEQAARVVTVIGDDRYLLPLISFTAIMV